ncbi:prenyltransferase/squalene oxidase repeat-containing protein [Amycolatopsis sp. cg5]|uniref:prenyltransferase/squalene oxidase repeat-containing protein n=1 Tax=Amycolatopsis sp. cg5 TaxID=3238802 RepID=UPI003524E946
MTRVALDTSLARAVDALFARRRADGSWQDTLPSAAVSTASAMVALRFADPDKSAALIAGGARWLRETQNPDGGWGDAVGAPSTLNVTPYAVGALKFLEPEASADHVRRGLERIERFGGMAAVGDREQCRLFVMCEQFLAWAGLHDENKIMRLPMQVVLLPRWLRQKVSFTVPFILSWGLMQANTRPAGRIRRAINRLCEPRILSYLDDLHEFEGPGGGYQESPFMVALVCIGLARAGVRPDIVRRCVDYLRATVRPDGAWPVNRDLELSATTFVTHGLQDAGERERLAPTLDWIRRCQRDVAFPATGCPPGGWGWSLRCGWPDTDDTADALIALARAGHDRTDGQVRSGLDWLRAMQNRNGSWSCFTTNNPIDLDAACSVMSAHAVTALREAGGLTVTDEPIAKALRWFAKTQRPDGAFTCPWYRGLTAGTGAVLDALGGLGLADSAVAHRCSEWLLANQNADGGWGPGSTAEDTAWALLGLLGAGAHGHPAVARGVEWLTRNQRPDGLWEPDLLGVYFLDLMYSCDLLATGYAVQALARFGADHG